MVALNRSNTWKNFRYETDQVPAVIDPQEMLAKMAEVLHRSAAGEVIDTDELDRLLGFASQLLEDSTRQLRDAIEALNELKAMQAQNDQ